MNKEPASDRNSEAFDEEDFKYNGEIYGEYQYSPYIGIGSWGSSKSSEVSEEDLVDKSLSFLEASAVVVVLEDAIDELSILKYVIGAPVLKPPSSIYKTLKQRFTRKTTPERRYPEMDNIPVLTTAIKLQRDRELIRELLKNVKKELSTNGSYASLNDILTDLRKQAEDEENLVLQLDKNLLTVKDLQIAVEQKKKLDDQEEKGRDEFVYALQDELDDVKLKCEVERNFVNTWENVRKAQNLMRLKNVENDYNKQIEELNINFQTEERVTSEFQQFLKMKQNELEEKLETWMATYDSEVERRENKLLHLKYDRNQAIEKKKSLQEMIKDRKKEMEDWVQFREQRRRRSMASLKIQSWWRGMMVRKKLGPYKSKKQKKFKQKVKKN